MRRIRWALVATAWGVVGLVSQHAGADDTITAQQLFEQGQRLMGEGRTAEACTKFEGAAELSATPGVRLNLGDCYAKLGRLASAWATYESAATIAERAGQKVELDLARQRKAAVEPDLPHLTIDVPPSAQIEGIVVERDHQKVPRAAWGTAVAVDPGTHEVQATAPGRKPWSGKVTLAGPRATQSITVPVLEAVPVPAAPPDAPTASTPDPVAAKPDAPQSKEPSARRPLEDGSAQRALGWTLGAVGLAAGVTGAVLAVSFATKANAALDTYHDTTQTDDARAAASGDYDSAKSNRTSSVILAGAGGAVMVTGLILLVTAPSADAKDALRVSPWATASSGGATVMGVF